MTKWICKACGNLIACFGSERKRSLLILALFIAGIVIFVLNNTILFFVEDEKNYLIPRLIMRFLTSATWYWAACLGTARNRTKRNYLLLASLFFYMPGDLFAMVYVPFSALFYTAGHILLIIAIMDTTSIKVYQYLAFLCGFSLTAVLFLLYFKALTLVCVIGIVYGTICSWVMAASLSNRFYSLAGLVFFVSDLTGFLRKVLMNTKPVYLVTTFIYYFSIFLLCISVFNESRKEVVTWLDMKRVLLSADKRFLKVFLAGRWGMNLVLGHKKFFYEKMDIAYSFDEKEKVLEWLKASSYMIEEGHEDGVLECYSEKFGRLNALPFRQSGKNDGEAILIISNHKELVLDAGFFTSVKSFGKTIPCLVPGANLLV